MVAPTAQTPAQCSTSCIVQGAATTTPSALYGCQGELWSPTQRLLDYSYAGYMAGDAPIPDVPVLADLKRNYSAVGDGDTDDTPAFVAAAADPRLSGGALYLAPGRYV